ncbi:hypothetical protein GY45DRAFT_1208458, partial [Cubamyces sp. BRFM 1775]
YITQFTRLTTQVRWGNAPLRYRFYDGLPNRLKDRISEVGKPDNLVALRDLTQSIDNRYWERKAEVSRDSGSSKPANKGNSDSAKGHNSGNKSSGGNSAQSASNQSKPANNARSLLKSPKTPKPQAKLYSDKLGKDGKLTQEERQRR